MNPMFRAGFADTTGGCRPCVRSLAAALAAAVAAVAAVAAAGVALLPAPAVADDFPKRKPGLWEMKTTGGPVGAQTVQQCIDANTDDMLRTRSNEGENCTKPAVARTGDRYRVSSSCDGNGVKSTTQGEYSMSGDTGYTGDMKMTFTPPMSGVSEMNMKMEGRWMGACKSGMKPGDIVMQGMPTLNVLEPGSGGAVELETGKAR